MEENRRTKMTKKLIHEAFLELLEHHAIEKISVTDICKVADVNRSTFYAYYNDVSELLREIENEVLSQVPVPQDAQVIYTDNKAYLDLLEKFFIYVKDNERLFNILITKSGNGYFNQKLIELIMSKYQQENSEKTPVFVQYGYYYAINGVIGILRVWITQHFPISPKKFSKIVLELSLRANSIREEDIN